MSKPPSDPKTRTEETTMEIKLGQNFPIFKDFISLLKIAGGEHHIVADEEGLKVISMDPGHVLMVDATVKKELFEGYTLSEDQTENAVTVNVNELFRFLDRIEKDEKVHLKYDKPKARFIINSTQAGSRTNFELPVMEDFDAEVPQPKIIFTAMIRMTVKAIEHALKNVNLVSEHAVINIIKDLVEIIGEGDIGRARKEWDPDSDDILDLKVEKPSKATYTLEYLVSIINAFKPLTDSVKIHLSTDMPIKIEAECKNQNITAICYLAPCIGV